MRSYKIPVFAKYFSIFIQCLEKATSSTCTLYKYITKLDSKSQKIPKARGSQIRSIVWTKMPPFQKTPPIKHMMFFRASIKPLEYTALGDPAERVLWAWRNTNEKVQRTPATSFHHSFWKEKTL